MASNFGEQKKKSGYEFLLFAAAAVIVIIIATWFGYILEDTATKNGIQWLDALNSIPDYADPAAFVKAFGAVFTGTGIAKKGMVFGFLGGMLIILWKFAGSGKRYHRRGTEHGSARWGNRQEKDIIADTNDFYNNVIAASDVFLVLDRKKRDINAMTEKEKRAKIRSDRKKEKNEKKRIDKLTEKAQENSPLGNSESLKKFSEKEQTDIFADKRDNGPNRSAKYPDSEAVPETSGIRREERIKKAKEMRQSVTEDNTDCPNTEKTNEEKSTSSGSEQAEENAVGESQNPKITQTENVSENVPSEKVQDKIPTSKEDIPADPQREKMLKKAAFIKQMNEEKVTLSVMAQSEENTTDERQNPKITQTENVAENVSLEKVQ